MAAAISYDMPSFLVGERWIKSKTEMLRDLFLFHRFKWPFFFKWIRCMFFLLSHRFDRIDGHFWCCCYLIVERIPNISIEYAQCRWGNKRQREAHTLHKTLINLRINFYSPHMCVFTSLSLSLTLCLCLSFYSAPSHLICRVVVILRCCFIGIPR